MTKFNEDSLSDLLSGLRGNSNINEIPTVSYSKLAKDNVNLPQIRLSISLELLNKYIPGIDSYNWKLTDSDNEFRGFTTGTISGVDANNLAKKLVDLASSKILNRVEEVSNPEYTISRFSSPEINNIQLFFYNYLNNPNGNKVVIAIKPFNVKATINIEI